MLNSGLTPTANPAQSYQSQASCSTHSSLASPPTTWCPSPCQTANSSNPLLSSRVSLYLTAYTATRPIKSLARTQVCLSLQSYDESHCKSCRFLGWAKSIFPRQDFASGFHWTRIELLSFCSTELYTQFQWICIVRKEECWVR